MGQLENDLIFRNELKFEGSLIFRNRGSALIIEMINLTNGLFNMGFIVFGVIKVMVVCSYSLRSKI